MVWLGGKARSIEEGMKLCQSAIWSGAAYEKFLAMVNRQGGDVRFVREPGLYPGAAVQLEVKSPADGFVSGIAARELGMLAIELGAGRKRIEDKVDPKAGIVLKKKLGDRVTRGEPLARLYTDDGVAGEKVRQAFRDCFLLSPQPVEVRPRVRLVIDDAGVRTWATPAII
jgi:pyrimidine-nucleoside phosphorylase